MESHQFRPTARAWLYAVATASVLWLAAIAVAAPASDPPPAAPPKTDAELSRLRDFLVNPERTLATRRDAAGVLIEKDTPASRAILLEILTGPTPSEAVLAVLDTIAGQDSPSEEFLDPFFQLLRSDDEATRRGAILALGAYQGNANVLLRLRGLATASETPVPVRLAAIQALAQIVDKRSIEMLVLLTVDPKSTVAAAAADALADVTGLKGVVSPSREAWVEWWKKHEQDSESLLLANLLRRSREELKRRDAAIERLQARLMRQLGDLYDAADAKEKMRLAQEHLEDSVPQVRALAARQATALARTVLGAGNGTARQPYQELITAISKHASDESPLVRAAAADALAAWKETAAGPALLARLEVEKMPEVRASLAAALGALKVAEAVPRLATMLDSPNEAEVLRAVGALGSIGDKSSGNPSAVEPAVVQINRLARTAPQPAVREAACLALAKILPPAAEEVLTAALEDAAASVRFSAAQGLGNLSKISDKTAGAIAVRLTDENKGVRQAAAAALAKLGGAEAARKMADRLKISTETEPAVRNALWTAIKTLVEHAPSPDLATELGDRFFAREGAEEMQHAAAMYEAAIAKFAPADRSGQAVQTLYEKLVDAYVAAGQPESAIPTLRQLLAATPPENVERIRELNQQLGLVLLAKEPYADAVPLLVSAMKGMSPDARLPLLKVIQSRAEALLKADRPDQAMDLLAALAREQSDRGGTVLTDSLKQLKDQAVQATTARAVAQLSGPDDQAAAATAALKKIGRPAMDKLLDALEAAAKAGQNTLESRVLAAIEAIGGGKDPGYNLQSPLDDRLNRIAAWRQKL